MSRRTCQMESVRRSISEHMTSVAEEILCVLDKQQLELHIRVIIRVFVLDRLSAVTAWTCELFQREMETLLDTQNNLLDIGVDMDVHLNTADLLHVPVCKDKRSSSLVQEEPQPPQIKDGQEELLQRPEEAGASTFTLQTVRREDDDDENRETESVAGTSIEHMKTQADVEDCGTSQPTGDEQLLSSHCSESDTEDNDEWKETSGEQSALNTLKSHKTQHGPCSCTVCSKSFRNTSVLKTHMRTHTGEKLFTCKVCRKGLSTNGTLKTHMMTHTEEKPFLCTICGKGCVSTSHLKAHMMTHTEEKPFLCTICGKGCVSTSHLKAHMRIHTGEKPYTCKVCGRRFSEMANLKKHMLTHTGEKPFSCTVCGNSFTQRSAMKTHMRTHTRGKPFSCTV